jgi:hypothetical protein
VSGPDLDGDVQVTWKEDPVTGGVWFLAEWRGVRDVFLFDPEGGELLYQENDGTWKRVATVEPGLPLENVGWFCAAYAMSRALKRNPRRRRLAR